jgi:hypothetical protein
MGLTRPAVEPAQGGLTTRYVPTCGESAIAFFRFALTKHSQGRKINLYMILHPSLRTP